ncbi:MAG: glycosyltransferase family 2 protein [Oscillospiraceae bacterium]|jgi:glycosyltransferase involved in cell wall biosynthesis|nr:glycosyltransferase family 2 protein [Oscillospiraceae bacterium]
MKELKTLYIIIPCYNEEAALPLTSEIMLLKLRQLKNDERVSDKSRILLIDDGSTDKTWTLIAELAKTYKEYVGMKLSRNRGTQNALAAGHEYARTRADAVITTDADLQDDITAIDRMTDEFINGADIVYGVRNKRDKDTFKKRFTAERFYKLMNWLGAGTVYNHSDFRLLSRRALDALSEYPERDMFIRGIVPMLGFKTAVVTYERRARNAGETKYTTKSLMKLAMNGVTSLSIKPLRIVTKLGIAMLVGAVIALAASLVGLFAFGYPILNWKIITVTTWLVGGIIILTLGIVGEYIGRMFEELKHRPRYHIEEITGAGNEK